MTSEKFESLRCTALRMTLGGKGTFSDNIYAKVNRMLGGFLRRNVKIACTKITELTSPGRKAIPPVPAAKPWHVPSLSMIYKYSVGTLLCSLLFVLVTRTT